MQTRTTQQTKKGAYALFAAIMMTLAGCGHKQDTAGGSPGSAQAQQAILQQARQNGAQAPHSPATHQNVGQP